MLKLENVVNLVKKIANIILIIRKINIYIKLCKLHTCAIKRLLDKSFYAIILL